jgi:hypothetical protein
MEKKTSLIIIDRKCTPYKLNIGLPSGDSVWIDVSEEDYNRTRVSM